MVEALWFFGGAISFQLLSKLFRYGQLVHFTSEVGLYILNLCALIEYDVAYMRALKYKQLRDSGVEEKQIQLIKDIDKESINNWKHSVILKFKQTLPKSVRGVFAFNDWDGAMRVLDQHLKRERQKK
jgi:CRISPR/Cas system-associated endonuclease Cas1